MLAASAGRGAQTVEPSLMLGERAARVQTTIHPVADATLASRHPVKLAPVGLVPIQGFVPEFQHLLGCRSISPARCLIGIASRIAPALSDPKR